MRYPKTMCHISCRLVQRVPSDRRRRSCGVARATRSWKSVWARRSSAWISLGVMAGSPSGSAVPVSPPDVPPPRIQSGQAGPNADGGGEHIDIHRCVGDDQYIDERRYDEGMVPMGAGQWETAGSAAAGLPVVVIGGGPVGLAAAANLLERGLE